MPTVVFDTSVLIPLILKASHSTRLFLRLRGAGWHVAVSPQIMAEAREKMETKRSVREWWPWAFVDGGVHAGVVGE